MEKFKVNRLLTLSLTTAISLIASASFAETQGATFGSQIIDAADHGDISQVQNLIGSGFSPDERGQFGATALMRAVTKNNLQLVKVLLSSGATPDIKDIGGATAALIAAREGHNEILQALIQGGADVNQRDNEGFTPLMRASLAGNQQAVQLLLSSGAKVNLANSFGETALSQSKSEGKLEIATLLTQSGANDSVAEMPEKAKIISHVTPKSQIREIAQEQDNADIIIDFSQGKLHGKANASKPQIRQIAQIKQPEYYAGSFYVPEKNAAPIIKKQNTQVEQIDIPAKPAEQAQTITVEPQWLSDIGQVAQTAIRPYQLASEQMIVPGTQNNILELGNFKSPAFANKRLLRLKNNFPDLFASIPAKVVEKGNSTHKYYQINAGIIASNQEASDLCKKLVSSGVNCRATQTDLKNQDEFNSYSGDIPAPAVVAIDNNEKKDVLGGAPSPKVQGKSLSASASNIGSFASYDSLTPAADEPTPPPPAAPTPLKSIVPVEPAPAATPALPEAAPTTNNVMAPPPAPTMPEVMPITEAKPAENPPIAEVKPAETIAQPAMVAASPEVAPAPKPVKKKRKWHKKLPAPGQGTPPRDLTTGQPLSMNTDGKFEVARPVKATADITPSWIKIDNFTNPDAARDFIDNLRAQNPSLVKYRSKVSAPFTMPEKTTAQLGPFTNQEEMQGLCAAISQSGLNCSVVGSASSPRLIENMPPINQVAATQSSGQGGEWIVQLGSYDSYEAAQGVWDDYASQSRNLKKMPNYIMATEGRYRLRAGNFHSSAQADSFCDTLRAKSISCIIIKN